MYNFERIVSKNIKKLRIMQGLTQQELAEEAEISIRGLGKIEKAEGEMRLSSVVKCAKGLNVHPAYLFLETISGALPFNYTFPERLLKTELVRSKYCRELPAGQKFLYKMTLNSRWSPLQGVSQEYGIAVYQLEGKKEVLVDKVEEVSSDNNVVGRLVHILNLYKVGYIHLYDVLEDELDGALEQKLEEDPGPWSPVLV